MYQCTTGIALALSLVDDVQDDMGALPKANGIAVMPVPADTSPRMLRLSRCRLSSSHVGGAGRRP
jgi:hypothetical protein